MIQESLFFLPIVLAISVSIVAGARRWGVIWAFLTIFLVTAAFYALAAQTLCYLPDRGYPCLERAATGQDPTPFFFSFGLLSGAVSLAALYFYVVARLAAPRPEPRPQAAAAESESAA